MMEEASSPPPHTHLQQLLPPPPGAIKQLLPPLTPLHLRQLSTVAAPATSPPPPPLQEASAGDGPKVTLGALLHDLHILRRFVTLAYVW